MAKDPFAIPTMPDPQKELQRDMMRGLPPELRAQMKASYGGAGAENRRRPRITIDELNTRGVDAVKEKWPDLQGGKVLAENNPDNRGAIEKVFDFIDIPRNLVANAIGYLAGVDKDKLDTGSLGLKRVMMSDVLEKLGVQNQVARAIIGFVGDIAVDPLTYLSAGSLTGVKVASNLPRLTKAAVNTIDAGLRTGRMPSIVTNVIGDAWKAMKTPLEVATEIGKAVTRGDDVGAAARTFYKTFGLEGRQLLRIPFTQISGPTLKVGRQARAYKAMDVGAEGVQALKDMEYWKDFAGSAKAVAAKTAAEKAIADRDIVGLKGAMGDARSHLADLKRQFRVLATAVHSQGQRATRAPIPSGTVRSLQRKIDMAEGLLGWMRDTAEKIKAAPGELNPEFARALPIGGQAAETKWLRRSRGSVGRSLRKLEAGTPMGGVDVRRSPSGGITGMGYSPGPEVPGLRPQMPGPARGDIGSKVDEITGLRRDMRAQRIYRVLPPELQAKMGEIGRGGVDASGVRAALGAARDRSRQGYEALKYQAGEIEGAFGKYVEAATKRPDVYKLAEEVQMGKAYDPIKQPVRYALNRLFGQPYGTTNLRSKELALMTRGTLGAKAFADKAANLIVKDVDGLARQMTVQGMAKSDSEARQIIGMVLDLGSEANIAKLHATDAGRAFWQSMGVKVSALPGFQVIKGKVDDQMRKWLEQLRAAGIDTAQTDLGSFHRILDPEAAKWAKSQSWYSGGVSGVGGAAGQPFQKARNRAYDIAGEVLDPQTGKMVPKTDVMYAKPGEAEKMLPKGFKLTGTDNPVSAFQENEMYKSGKYSHLFGSDMPRDKVANMFDMDPVSSMSSRGFQQERSLASAEMQKLVNAEGIVVGSIDNDKLREAGYRAVRPLAPDNPLSSIMGEASPYGSTGKSYAYPAPVADMLDRYSQAFVGDKTVEQMMRLSDMSLAWFKRWALFHPGYVIRNVWQNTFGALMAGGPKIALKQVLFGKSKPVQTMLKAIGEGNLNQLGDATMMIAGKKHRLQDLAKAFYDLNGSGADRSAAEFASSIMRGSTPGRKAMRGIAQSSMQLSDLVRQGNQRIESSARIGTWLAFMDEGLDGSEAMSRTVMAMPDMSNVTQFERGAMARIMPWYRWMRSNGGAQLFHYLPQQPAWMASVGKFKNFLEGASAAWRTDSQNVPDELRPEWQREQQAPQITGDRSQGESLLLRNWFPFEEATNAMAAVVSPGTAARGFISQARPGIKFLAEAATGRDIFRQAPLKTPDTVEAIKAIPQALMGSSGTAMDNLLSIRPLKEYGRRVWEQPTTGGKIMRATIGGAAQPLDAQQGLKAMDIKTNEQMGELRRLIVRAKENGDAVEEKRLLQLFMLIQAERQRLGLLVSKSTQQTFSQQGMTQQPSYPWIKQVR